MINVVASVNKSVWNAPALYGAHVRKVGEVTDFTSGLKEAGKVKLNPPVPRDLYLSLCQGLWWGYYDSVANVIVEPIRGARQDGVRGFFKGAGRGCELTLDIYYACY